MLWVARPPASTPSLVEVGGRPESWGQEVGVAAAGSQGCSQGLRGPVWPLGCRRLDGEGRTLETPLCERRDMKHLGLGAARSSWGLWRPERGRRRRGEEGGASSSGAKG